MKLIAPHSLISHGQPRFGQFSDSLSTINHADFQLHTPFGKPANFLSNWMGFKQFQYFGGMSERFIFGCALAHLRHVGVAFVYVYDTQTQRLFSRSYRSPLGVGLLLSSNPVNGSSRFWLPGVDIRMGYQAAPREKTLSIALGSSLKIDATMPEESFEPMSLCTRAAYSGWVYANKTAGLGIHGALCFEGNTYDLAELGAMGHHDFSCGFMRRETYWNWACFSGTSGGHRLGLNLSCGVNETSFTENCLWLDGKLIKVNLTRFAFNQRDVMQPWHIYSDDGQVDLHFTAMGMHQERMNLGLVASNFKQVFGHFHGELRIGGTIIAINGIPGFAEDQYAKW